jgi:hypothetical protein
MLENTEVEIKNGQLRETGITWYTRRRKTKQKTQYNMCWTQTNTNNVNVIRQEFSYKQMMLAITTIS